MRCACFPLLSRLADTTSEALPIALTPRIGTLPTRSRVDPFFLTLRFFWPPLSRPSHASLLHGTAITSLLTPLDTKRIRSTRLLFLIGIVIDEHRPSLASKRIPISDLAVLSNQASGSSDPSCAKNPCTLSLT